VLLSPYKLSANTNSILNPNSYHALTISPIIYVLFLSLSPTFNLDVGLYIFIINEKFVF
jgi:uncharacterized membrane protein